MRTLKLPFAITSTGSAETVSDPHQIIKQKIVDILTTTKRERVMNPGYGAGVYRFIYEMLDPLVFADFKRDAIAEMNRELTGVEIRDLVIDLGDSLTAEDFNTTATITVYYRIPPLQMTSMTFSVSEFVVADTPV